MRILNKGSKEKYLNEYILPINENPILKCYSHEAEMMSIITNPQICGKFEAIFESPKWKFQKSNNQGVEILKDEKCNISEIPSINRYIISGSEVDAYFRNYIYKKVNGDGNFEITISSMTRQSTYTQSGIMIMQDINNWVSEQDVIKFSYFAKNTLYLELSRFDKKYKDIKIDNVKLPVSLFITVKSGKIDFSIREKDKKKELIFELNMNSYADIYIGFYGYSLKSDLENWINNNFIQMHCDQYLTDVYEVPIDYFGFIHTNGLYNTLNPWIKTESINRQLIQNISDIMGFLRQMLSENKYIHLMLNEYYIENRAAFGKKYYEHANLIYGYDDNNKFLYISGFDSEKRYCNGKISYSEFIDSYNSVKRDTPIYLLEPIHPFIDLQFDLSLVIQYLKEYYSSIDSNYVYRNMYTISRRQYGLNIYDVIVANLDKLSDIRIIYIMWEHKILMKNRLRFLYQNNFLRKEEYTNLLVLCDELIEKTNLIKLEILKASKRNDNQKMLSMGNEIIELKEKDRAFTKLLIECLSCTYACTHDYTS